MGSKNTYYALYNDDDVLLSAVKKIRESKIDIEEVYTHFPVHGLDKEIGITVATLMMYYIMIVDWPQNIGGKPSFSYLENMPAFVPIMFEMTVFHAAHLMVITFYLRSRMWPLKKAENPDPRTTDDHFLIELSSDKTEASLKKFLKQTGAVEINKPNK